MLPSPGRAPHEPGLLRPGPAPRRAAVVGLPAPNPVPGGASGRGGKGAASSTRRSFVSPRLCLRFTASQHQTSCCTHFPRLASVGPRAASEAIRRPGGHRETPTAAGRRCVRASRFSFTNTTALPRGRRWLGSRARNSRDVPRACAKELPAADHGVSSPGGSVGEVPGIIHAAWLAAGLGVSHVLGFQTRRGETRVSRASCGIKARRSRVSTATFSHLKQKPGDGFVVGGSRAWAIDSRSCQLRRPDEAQLRTITAAAAADADRAAKLGRDLVPLQDRFRFCASLT